jgi:hypothetical protein
MNAMAIKSKALLMLVVFTANFYTVCHCTTPAHTTTLRSCPSESPAAPSHQPSCCQSHHPNAHVTNPQAPQACPDDTKPCNNKDGCCQTHSIKFNLLEKQTAPPVAFQPLSATVLTPHFISPVAALSTGITLLQVSAPEERYRKKAPPDLLSLYQFFRI